MINLYIDALAKAGEWDALDRVIEAQAWRVRAFGGDGFHCLMGHVESDGLYERERCRVHEVPKHLTKWRRLLDCIPSGAYRSRLEAVEAFGTVVGFRFDELVKRFGMDRVVRAIKLRAGRHTKPASLTDSAVQKQVAHA